MTDIKVLSVNTDIAMTDMPPRYAGIIKQWRTIAMENQKEIDMLRDKLAEMQMAMQQAREQYNSILERQS